MIYCQTINKECIAVHPMDDVRDTQFIELVKYGDVPMFAVWIDGGEYEWLWEFELTCPSDYERIKFSIFDAIYRCDTMLEIALALDKVFEEAFSDILIVDECENCEGCDCCGECKYLC